MKQCGLSPDGSMFVYFMLDYSNNRYNTLTVVSRPPYWTGIYVQEEEGHWTGGGYFETNDKLVLKPYNVKMNQLSIKIIDPYPNQSVGRTVKDSRVITLHRPFALLYDHYVKIENGRFYVDSKLIADFNEMNFEKIKAPY